MNSPATTDERFEHVLELMTRLRGDEKHQAAADSSLHVLWVLYERVLRHDPARPDWPDRDRFVLSKAHGPMSLYAILALHGYFPAAELDRYRAWDGILGGHPDRLRVGGIEVSAGSLGHGFPIASGMALRLRALGSDSHVFVLAGDGELNEGSCWEAIISGPRLRLANLTLIVVDNGSSSVEFGDLGAKLSCFGWDAITVDGRDERGLEEALTLKGGRPRRAPRAVVAVVRGPGA